MVASKSSFLLSLAGQTPDSPSLPLNFPYVPGFRFLISLRPYFITSSTATQDRSQPQFPQSLAHTFRHIPGAPPCTPSFDFPISYFVFSTASASPLSATLTGTSQLHENKVTLSLAFATLTRRVKLKSFVCHSYKKHRGVGYPSIADPASFSSRPFRCTQRRPFTPSALGEGQSLSTHGFTSRSSGYPGGGCWKHVLGTPRLLCKNRSAYDLGPSWGGPHLLRGVR
jgi:hypothetical protein